MRILQVENGELRDIGWLYKHELHKKAIIFPYTRHHREIPTSNYPCALCGKHLKSSRFIYAFIHNSDSSYAYLHINCISKKFGKTHNVESVINQENEDLQIQGSLF